MSSSKQQARRGRGNVLVREGRTDVSYCIRFRTDDGHRHFEVVGRKSEGATRKDAEEALALRLAEIRTGSFEDPRTPRPPEPDSAPTLEGLAEMWLGERGVEIVRGADGIRLVGGEYATSSLVRMRVTLGHLLSFFADPPARDGTRRAWRVDEIGPEDVRRLLLEKRKSLAGSTVKMTGSTLVSIFDLGVEEQILSRNVARRPVSKLRCAAPRRTYLSTAGEIEDLLAGAAILDREADGGIVHREAFVATMAFGGLRISEALALRWRDVSLAEGSMRVPGTKTAAADREIELLPPLRSALAVIKPERADRHAFVFPTGTGTRQRVDNARRRWFGGALRVANEVREVEGRDPMPPLTPHGLRRTNVTILAACGWSLTDIADAVGHADIGVTNSIYRKAISRRDGERERLAALINGEPLTPQEETAVRV